jgi:hypothetical protein
VESCREEVQPEGKSNEKQSIFDKLILVFSYQDPQAKAS